MTGIGFLAGSIATGKGVQVLN